MKFTKICILLLLLIISIGAVSAAEEVNDMVSTDDGSHGVEPALLKNTIDDDAVEIDEGSQGLEPAELGNTQDDINALNEVNDTFTDLSNEINMSTGTFEIEHNYKFNNKTDNSPVVINKDDFVINGNNHILDGSNQSTIFHINGTNITINNLVFVNGNNVNGGLLVSKKKKLYIAIAVATLLVFTADILDE